MYVNQISVTMVESDRQYENSCGSICFAPQQQHFNFNVTSCAKHVAVTHNLQYTGAVTQTWQVRTLICTVLHCAAHEKNSTAPLMLKENRTRTKFGNANKLKE